MSLSRRTLLGTGAAGLASSALGLSPLQRARAAGTKQPKNVIFCVADGMSQQTLSMADAYQRLVLGKPSYWASLMNEEYAHNGLQITRSLNSVVTDSSAASSSWGSGRHIWNGQVNVFPDGTELRTLTSLMSQAGVRCGLVTTTTITHATPAGFAVNCINRDLEGLIAERYMTSGVDVLMGGGDKFFSAEKRKDKKDLYGQFEKAGFKVVKNRDQALAARSGKVLGIFGDSHLPFSVDRNNSPTLQAAVPTLAEMTRLALENLKGSPKGFLLQIEGGKVDHGNHSNDLAAALYDQIAFEEAVKEAVDFALKDGETLVIITADHACGGSSLNGAGDEYIDSTAGLKTVANMKSSYGPLLGAIGNAPSQQSVRDAVEAKLGIVLKPEEADGVVAAMVGKSPFALSNFHGSPGGTLAMILGNHSKVNWTGPNHTAEHVMLTAVGPGSEALAGLTENIKLFDLILASHGLKWSNPTMGFEEAMRHYEKAKPAAELFELYASIDEDDAHGHR